ncbi:MAG TPA: hypothetical protein VMR52_02160 [Dehalococcoidia bacterium]|nr:hypothetical protein [Dehalococcoidia bacterium]
MLRTAACLLALAALFSIWSVRSSADADELLQVTSNIHYAVRADETGVFVTWDISLYNNDPSTQSNLFYGGLNLPVLAGATDVAATSGGGVPLTAIQTDDEFEFIDRVEIEFDTLLFFGDSYNFTLSYRVPETRNDALLVIPSYYYIPLISLGDQATVTVDAPSGDPWQTDLTGQDCEPVGNGFQCGGSDLLYVAGYLEVRRPDLVSMIQFDAPLAASSIAVSLSFFHGEEATGEHQRAVIQAALPLLEEAYGFPPEMPSPDVSVSHGGRQAAFGYEGLTTCLGACQIVISPIASEQTLIHEFAHLWSSVYNERWLSEGFAEWVTRRVVQQIPHLAGGIEPYEPTSTPLQLDQWGYPENLVGADAEYIETTAAGYDLSLRFIEVLAEEVGDGALREANRRLAARDGAADSRIFMDTLEDVTRRNLDGHFLLWVLPEGSDPLLQERRDARNRLDSLETDIAAAGAPEGALDEVRSLASSWQFTSANTAMDAIEADVDRYAGLQSDLADLLARADALGVTVPGSLGSAVSRWEFDEASQLMESANSALTAYEEAYERVNESRSLWQKFGLIGDDPDARLARAHETFESGAFSRSRDHSEAAIDMIDDAGGAAARRLWLAAAILGAFALAFGLAYWLAINRQRGFGEER